MLLEDIDQEDFWEELLADIEERRVVPVLGSALTTALGDEGEFNLSAWLAKRLAERLRVDPALLPDPFSLNDVCAAFVGRGGRREEIYPKLRILLRELQAAPSPTLQRLAAIEGFQLFITLTWDTLLLQALDAVRGPGTQAFSYCPARAEDLPGDWQDAGSPVVYHLLGKASAAPEYAVTDEDVLEFVTSLQSGVRRPQLLFDALRSSHLLVLGTTFPDWLARFFLRVTKDRQLSLARSERELLVDTVESRDPALVSFIRNFSYGTRLIGLEPDAFVAELHRRWTEGGHRGAAAAPRAATVAAPARPAAEPRESMRPGGVFISYAREDLPQVLQLKASLDRAGIDAWLDKDRLEAGDLYDQKIRRFIKTCAVFLPVISRNTERRVEAYFRREWKLAAERAQGIAAQIPFVLPVVIDDTPEYGASVPDCFLDAQWTRLPGGNGTPEFEARLATVVAQFREREGRA